MNTQNLRSKLIVCLAVYLQWLACVSTRPCYTRNITAPSVGFVAKVNG